jgi:multiple sugar transport system ATP-binding protein
MAEVRLNGVSKMFGTVTAVDKVDLGVEDKEFLVLVGPSGCGKTTTLRMVAGLEEATEGDIFIGERKVNDVPPKDRDIAMVFQNYALYPHMNVYRNMAFGLQLRKFPKAEIDQRVKEGARILGIEELLQRKPKELSGGQRQRVAMGRAIVRKPQAFLFDEPLSNLDAKLRVAMRGELAKLHERLETTIIYVTHDQVEAMTLANRIVVMDEGLIAQMGSPLEVYNNPNNLFVAGFIGDQYERYAKIKEKKCILGLRPEHIYDKEIKGELPSGAIIKVTVDVVEPVGSEIILLVSCGSDQLTACVDPRTRAKPHLEMDLVIDMSKMHLFDPGTTDAY